MFHVHHNNDFTTPCDGECRSQNNQWNGGDYVYSTGVWPSPSDAVSDVTAAGLSCTQDQSCQASNVVGAHACGDMSVANGVTVPSCFGIDKPMEQNVMSYGFLDEQACPMFTWEPAQLARMRCWVDRHEYRSTAKETGPSLVTVVTATTTDKSIALSWVPPLNTLTEAWSASVDGQVGYEIHRTPAFTSGATVNISAASDNRRYTDTDVTADTTYIYRVRPFASGGTRTFSQSPLSPEFTFKTDTKSDDDKTIVYVAAGVGGGVAVLAIVLVLFFCVCKKKV